MPPDLPRGYRFHPTDAELINHHLKPKLLGHQTHGKSIIPEVDLRKVEPWDLPETSRLDTSEWYVFNLRHRAGLSSRVDRATPGGYWKSVGKERAVKDDGNNRMVIGMKKTFCHYTGKAPKGTRNKDWIMHEYRVEGRQWEDLFKVRGEYVLCRIFIKKQATVSTFSQPEQQGHYIDDFLSSGQLDAYGTRELDNWTSMELGNLATENDAVRPASDQQERPSPIEDGWVPYLSTQMDHIDNYLLQSCGVLLEETCASIVMKKDDDAPDQSKSSGSSTLLASAKGHFNLTDDLQEEATDQWNFTNNSPLDFLKYRHPCLYASSENIFGREEVYEKVIQILLQPVDSSEPSNEYRYSSLSPVCSKRARKQDMGVLSIIGEAGFGKTHLTKFIYNDPRVDNYFHLKMWIHMSDFDVTLLIEEIVKCVTGCNQSFLNQNALQEILKENIMSRRFLVVLDGMWPEAEDILDWSEWQKFCTQLKFGMEGSKLLVTTRSQKVGELVATMGAILLNGLPDDSYWSFFDSRALALECANEDNVLEKVKGIAVKLKGSLLAAEVLGGLLRSYAVQYNTMVDRILQSLQEENVTLAALQFGYHCIPSHLKVCLLLCSLFPKSYHFDKDLLVDIFTVVANCVSPVGNPDKEDLGADYFVDLMASCFLQKAPLLLDHFVIHDLLHDMLRSASSEENVRITNGKSEILKTVHHLSVWADDLELRNLMELGNQKQLVSLLVLKKLKVKLDTIIHFWCNHLTKLHWLNLSGCVITVLPENIGNLKFLRFLDVSYTRIVSLPDGLCYLHNLMILRVLDCPLEAFPPRFNNLINLRKLYARSAMFSKIFKIGNLTSLRDLPLFVVSAMPGYRIEELEGLKHLHGSLHVRSLENIKDTGEATRAKLSDKQYIDKLVLEWSSRRVASSCRRDFGLDEEVLEALQPHPNLKLLQLTHYFGSTIPTWLTTDKLLFLRGVWLENCCNLLDIPSLPSSITELKLINVGLHSLPLLWEESEELTDFDRIKTTSSIKSTLLSRVHIECCPNLSNIDDWLLPHHLPALRSIQVSGCYDLSSVPVERFSGFTHLEKLEIFDCPNLVACCQMSLPSSIKQLSIGRCGDLDRSFPNCLSNVTSLTSLSMKNCPRITSLPWKRFQGYNSLEKLEIVDCPNITDSEKFVLPTSVRCLILNSCGDFVKSLPGCLENLTSLTTLEIRNCPHITELPFQILQHLTALRYFTLENCDELRLLELPCFLYLKSFSILNCSKLNDPEMIVSEDDEEQTNFPALESLLVDKTSVIQLPCLWKRSRSILKLEINGSSEEQIFTGDRKEWFRSLSSLQELCIHNCINLQSLPEVLSSTPSLRMLRIYGCPKLTYLSEDSLPRSLRSLAFSNCNPVLMAQLADVKSRMKYRDYSDN